MNSRWDRAANVWEGGGGGEHVAQWHCWQRSEWGTGMGQCCANPCGFRSVEDRMYSFVVKAFV